MNTNEINSALLDLMDRAYTSINHDSTSNFEYEIMFTIETSITIKFSAIKTLGSVQLTAKVLINNIVLLDYSYIKPDECSDYGANDYEVRVKYSGPSFNETQKGLIITFVDTLYGPEITGYLGYTHHTLTKLKEALKVELKLDWDEISILYREATDEDLLVNETRGVIAYNGSVGTVKIIYDPNIFFNEVLNIVTNRQLNRDYEVVLKEFNEIGSDLFGEWWDNTDADDTLITDQLIRRFFSTVMKLSVDSLTDGDLTELYEKDINFKDKVARLRNIQIQRNRNRKPTEETLPVDPEELKALEKNMTYNDSIKQRLWDMVNKSAVCDELFHEKYLNAADRVTKLIPQLNIADFIRVLNEDFDRGVDLSTGSELQRKLIVLTVLEVIEKTA